MASVALLPLFTDCVKGFVDQAQNNPSMSCKTIFIVDQAALLAAFCCVSLFAVRLM